MSSSCRYKLVFFAPRVNTKTILAGLFRLNVSPDDSNAPSIGRIGAYSECAFLSPGVGQFRPLSGAQPAIGQVGQLELVEEDRVEVIVNDNEDWMRAVIKHLKEVHPYEEVAYDVYKLEDF